MAKSKKKTVARGTRKSTLKAKREKGAHKNSRRFSLQYVVLACFVLVGVSICLGLFLLYNGEGVFARDARAYLYQKSANFGFRVEKILVEGHAYTDSDALRALVGSEYGDPIFAFDPAHVKESIEKINWVLSARVERRLPQTIFIAIEERQPFALWKNAEKLAVIDKEGAVLTYFGVDRFKDLIMVRGTDAQKQSASLFMLLDQYKAFSDYIDHAELVDKRRWNLYLTDGKQIKLPEKNTDTALRDLLEQHHIHNILNQEAVSSIDVRYEGRLIVRTKLGKVQDYKTQSGVSL